MGVVEKCAMEVKAGEINKYVHMCRFVLPSLPAEARQQANSDS
ncbi:Uncharacterised protein [Paenibacillus macerans]|uniref:Uncharacterized protein n=1 Tax=Paenibacillus macerans TaxID=44252 RepID=A0A090ZCK3_PAEMA|nr:hypothetical protein [Paenibacillus macerans]KFN08382.1 hypothetical protein DJ90_1509 [Paenibacillus macerans]MDU5950021.1 hypothetical protein [Paenibacillus macerans]MEC0152500.1 hypothetical protein [Paenibacillus macerans]SUA83534.1 Uncharacterised protein [Paenibacillus macerans]GBK61948.1 hypothetical protein PbDSM24746_19520 [Paenibacillus macerans]